MIHLSRPLFWESLGNFIFSHPKHFRRKLRTVALKNCIRFYSTTENCQLCGIIFQFSYSSHPFFLTPCSFLTSALALLFLPEKVANWCTCYPLIYNCIYRFSCKELLTNCCSSVAQLASISFCYLRAKLNFLKLYCIFLLLGQKKHKRIQFSVVFALFILIWSGDWLIWLMWCYVINVMWLIDWLMYLIGWCNWVMLCDMIWSTDPWLASWRASTQIELSKVFSFYCSYA